MRYYFLCFLIIPILFSCNNEPDTNDIDTLFEEMVDDIEDDNDDASTVSYDKFSNEAGKFAINFPGEPDITNEVVPTELGNIDMYMFMYEQSLTKVYMVAYSDYPSALMEAGNVDDMLEGAMNGATTNMEIDNIEMREDVEIDGHKGLYFKAKGANGYHVVYKIYMVENRMYQIGILRDGAYADDIDLQSYINSFELI